MGNNKSQGVKKTNGENTERGGRNGSNGMQGRGELGKGKGNS